MFIKFIKKSLKDLGAATADTHRQTDRLTFGLLGLLSQPKIFQFSVEVCLQSMFAEDDNSLSEMMMALMIFCWGRYFLYYDVFHLHNKKNDDKNTLYFKTEIHFLYNKDCRNYFLHMSFKTFQLIVNWEWWFQNE